MSPDSDHGAPHQSPLRVLSASWEHLVIVGERGVGKTLLARLIHEESRFRHLPFLVADLRTMRDRDTRLLLLGSTSPEASRRSIMERPATVLIKGIGDAERYLQSAIASALASGTLLRPGGGSVRPVRARVMFTLEFPAGTTHPGGGLEPSLERYLGGCRSVRLPPLRRRKEEIPRLLGCCSRPRTPCRREAACLPMALFRHEWPGNLAELKGHMRGMVRLSHEEALREGERREVSTMLNRIEGGSAFSLRETMKALERLLLRRALLATGGRRTHTARLLGLTDRNLRRKEAGLP